MRASLLNVTGLNCADVGRKGRWILPAAVYEQAHRGRRGEGTHELNLEGKAR